MSDKKRILVADDEPQITRVLRRSLAAANYDVRTAADGIAALELFDDYQPDLIITDLSMPEMSGLELCREIRKRSNVPIIVLSVRGEEKIKIEALDLGVDDYVTKPFSSNELMARIRAALRRSDVSAAPDAVVQTVLADGDFEIDTASRVVTVRNRETHLTPKEFDLLVYLFEHRGKVITHRTLLAAIWGGNYTEQTEYLRVFVGNLRKKIETDTAKPEYILTEPWVGYRFNAGG